MWCFARFDLHTSCFDICHDVYLTSFQCVCDILKINFYDAVCLFSICLLSSFARLSDICKASFHRLFTEYRTSLETSSPLATSVHQDYTLTYAAFCFGYFEVFLLLAYLSLRASNFVLVSHYQYIFLSTSVLCLGYQSLAQSVFIRHILSIFYAL